MNDGLNSLTEHEWTEAAVRRQASLALLAAPDASPATSPFSDFDLNPDSRPGTQTLIAAAVLVAIVLHPKPSIVLTERTDTLSAHPGQIAFPGGRIELGETAGNAATREASEEIGLSPSLVDIVGYGDAYQTGTGYRVQPVVGLIKPPFMPRANPAEVADVFDVPLSFLLDIANYRIDKRMWRGGERRFYAIPFGHHYIWGATAGIMHALRGRLSTA